jgi:hypothetical protein
MSLVCLLKRSAQQPTLLMHKVLYYGTYLNQDKVTILNQSIINSHAQDDITTLLHNTSTNHKHTCSCHGLEASQTKPQAATLRLAAQTSSFHIQHTPIMSTAHPFSLPSLAEESDDMTLYSPGVSGLPVSLLIV